MKLHQLSLFLENRPGRLVGPCRVLADAGINILTLSLADTRQFGILRLIVRDWERARSALEAAGYVANITEVIAAEVIDRPGGLADMLAAFDNEHLNLEYLYAFTFKRGERGVMVFRFDNVDAALDALRRADIRVLSSEEIFELLENKSN